MVIMMKIIRTYTQQVPALRFIGKKYGDGDRVNGGFGQQWGQAFAPGGLLAAVEKLADSALCTQGGTPC